MNFRKVNFRSPAVLMAIGVAATLVLALVVVMALLETGGAKAVSDNAALIGALVALGGVFTAQMVSIALQQQRTRETRELEDRRTREARQLEAQRAHEAALQNYFEQVGELLIEQPLLDASPDDKLSTVVRAQTLTVLAGLDPDRKRILLLFLNESGLINKHKPVVDLADANLRVANLRESRLFQADLSYANLIGANLYQADLIGANLSGAVLSGAVLSGAVLVGADLIGADLIGADLIEADLIEADLSDAVLAQANLSEADLRGAKGVTNEQLSEARTLEGATMPDGQILKSADNPDGPTFEDWLKSKGRGEDVENE